MADPEQERYPSPLSDPRNFRSREANRKAALLTMGALLVVIVLIALFAS